MNGLSAEEAETVVTVCQADRLEGGVVRIDSTIRDHIRRLRASPKATLVAEGLYGSTAWATFTVPANLWNPVSGIMRTGTSTGGHLLNERTRRTNGFKRESEGATDAVA